MAAAGVSARKGPVRCHCPRKPGSPARPRTCAPALRVEVALQRIGPCPEADFVLALTAELDRSERPVVFRILRRED